MIENLNIHYFLFLTINLFNLIIRDGNAGGQCIFVTQKIQVG